MVTEDDIKRLNPGLKDMATQALGILAQTGVLEVAVHQRKMELITRFGNEKAEVIAEEIRLLAAQEIAMRGLIELGQKYIQQQRIR